MFKNFERLSSLNKTHVSIFDSDISFFKHIRKIQKYLQAMERSNAKKMNKN